MVYNSWKLLDSVVVAVKHKDVTNNPFTGYIVDSGDKKALETAKDWARVRNYDFEKREYTETLEPEVHTFENSGFRAKILDSAGGSSQGGRLSFWRCEVEKDGVKFTIGVNDAILADLIKNSTIINGEVQEQLMFARRAGQPGLIHRGMDSYKEAVADMKKKADLKSAKKTTKWEIGGIYGTLTGASICLGKVFDTKIEVPAPRYYGDTYSTNLIDREEPIEVTMWSDYYLGDDEDKVKSFADFLELRKDKDSWYYVKTGTPPSRAKTGQLDTEVDYDKLLKQYISKVTSSRYKIKI